MKKKTNPKKIPTEEVLQSTEEELVLEASKELIAGDKKALAKSALQYHRGSSFSSAIKRKPGKLEINASKSLLTQKDLSLAYSPGVAEPCKEIQKDPDLAYKYTAKGNLVAVISNGTAVLGLGDIGALAGKPVFEGKAVLFKKYAEIDSIDIEVDEKDPQKFVDIVSAISPTFGGINLEDISAPECFEIETKLQEKLSIPVFHDDQHGTAIISGAAIINACEIAGKKIKDLKIVFCGGGAASIACARFWLDLGVQKKNCIMTDRHGVIYKGRKEAINSFKAEFAIKAEDKKWCKKKPRALEDAMDGADCFVGLSRGGIVSGKMLKKMSANPIVFAMANPDPEITYEEAFKTRKDMIFATGRSDYPNQVNNVLCFPFLFRGALDVRAKKVNSEMKIAASQALAELTKQDVPSSIIKSYDLESLSFGRKYIIPKPFDQRALVWVASAVAEAAVKTKVSRCPCPGGSLEAYRQSLLELMEQSHSVMNNIKTRYYKKKKRKQAPKIVFPEALSAKILKAVEILAAEKIAKPILLGNPTEIKNKISELNLNIPDDVKIIHPRKSDYFDKKVSQLLKLRQRKGLTKPLAQQWCKDPFYYGAMMLNADEADAWIGGVTRSYPDAIKPVLRTIGSVPSEIVAGLHMLTFKDRILFFADTTMNIDPSDDELANIAIETSNYVKMLGFEPRIAMVSFSSFGSNSDTKACKVRNAVNIVKKTRPDILIDGEVQAGTAVDPELFTESFPFSPLAKSGANVLIFPDLSSANCSYKLLNKLGKAEAVGPILMGINKPAHVLPYNASESNIVNLSIMAALNSL